MAGANLEVNGVLEGRIVEHMTLVGELLLQVALELGQELNGGRRVLRLRAALHIADAVVVAPRAEDVPKIVKTAGTPCVLLRKTISETYK